jgi:hypothetical protein
MLEKLYIYQLKNISNNVRKIIKIQIGLQDLQNLFPRQNIFLQETVYVMWLSMAI